MHPARGVFLFCGLRDATAWTCCVDVLDSPVPADLLDILLRAACDADHDCTVDQIVAAMMHGVLRFGGDCDPYIDCGDA